MMVENFQTIALALAMLLVAALVGRIIHRRNSWPVAITLGAVLMAFLNRMLEGMGFWYLGDNEPVAVQAMWYALHLPVILYIRSGGLDAANRQTS